MATKTVRRKQVRDLTFKLLTENGLEGWHVRFNPRLTRALGRCSYYSKTIDYQPRYMAQNDWEQVRTTILHEVAHAIAGQYAGHGASWARAARALGLENPSAINHTATLTKKFTGTCEGCGVTVQRDRRQHGIVHTACQTKRLAEIRETGKSEQRATIRWTRND